MVEKANDGGLFVRVRHWQLHVTKVGISEAGRTLPYRRTCDLDKIGLGGESQNYCKVAGNRTTRTRGADDVFGCAFSVAVRNPNGSGEGIHRMDNELSFSYTLVTCLEQGDHKSAGAAIPSKRDLSVTEAGHDFI